MSIFAGSVSNILTATVYNTDGTVKTDLAFNTTGISIVVKRLGQLDSTALTLAAKAAANTAFAAGAFLNLGNGRISIDTADAYFATAVRGVWLSGSFTGGTIVGDLEQVVGYNPNAVAVGANTVAPPSVGSIQSGLATQASVDNVIDTVSFIASGLFGAIANAGTATETYAITINGGTFTATGVGLDATGNRTSVGLVKS